MELMTDELRERFKQFPLYSQDGKMGNAIVVVKYFNPLGAGTWFITEGNELDNGDYELFGYCHLGDDDMAEFGTVMLSELKNIKLPFGMTIERDLYMKEGVTLKEVIKEEGFKLPSYFENDYEVEDELEDDMEV